MFKCVISSCGYCKYVQKKTPTPLLQAIGVLRRQLQRCQLSKQAERTQVTEHSSTRGPP
jgi:hypothetical protein